MKLSLTLVCAQVSRNLRAGYFPSDEILADAEIADMQRLVWEGGNERPSLVLCSHARAAKQTAEALGFHDSVKVPALNDLDYGAWKGRSLKELDAADLAAWLQDVKCEVHGGESFFDARQRIAEWWRLQNFPTGHCLIFTHANVIKLLVLELLKAPTDAVFHMDIAPLSQTQLTRWGQRWQITAVGVPSSRSGMKL